MKITRATKTNLLRQMFGLKNTFPNMIEFYKSIGLKNGHNGWDFGVQCKDWYCKTGGQCENIYFDVSDCYGRIDKLYKDDINTGYGIKLITEDKDGIFQHRFWHFDSINPLLKVGDILSPGDLLGVSGNTGYSTGAHLHRDLKKMGRDTYGNLYEKEIGNGYDGCCDIAPYFQPIFICDLMNGLQAKLTIIQQMVGIYKKLIELLKK